MIKGNKVIGKKHKYRKEKLFSVFYNYFYSVCSAALCKVFNARCNVSEDFSSALNADCPMLILGNHLSSIDFVFMSQPLWGKKVSFVVADNMKYSNKFLFGALNHYHSIFKKQFYPDIYCIKRIKTYLDNGISVVICPEGKVSAEGVTGNIEPSIGKLIKFLNYPVGQILVSGAGLTRPKWAYSFRRGKVEAEAKMIFTKEQIETLSVDEIYEIVKENLMHNEHKYQAENHLMFKGKKIAEGLERVLYKCPKCGKEFCIQTQKDIIRCLECGNEIRYMKDGSLKPINADSVAFDRIDLWAEWEKNQVRQEIKNGQISLSYPVWLFKDNAKKTSYEFIADGNLKFDGKFISFESYADWCDKKVKLNFNVSYMTAKIKKLKNKIPIDKKYQKMVFNISGLPTLANIPGDTFDIVSQNETYRFMFPNTKASTKLAYAVEIFYETKHKKQE